MAKNPGDRGAWKKGDRQFGAIHKGRTYLFTSAENQQKFLQNPDGYAPVFSGCDPVLHAERGQMVDGKRAFGLVTADRHIYLFADEASRNRFEKSPASYMSAIQTAAAHKKPKRQHLSVLVVRQTRTLRQIRRQPSAADDDLCERLSRPTGSDRAGQPDR